VAAARLAGCDVLVTGELRYHEALDAVSSGLSVIEAGHDATEWPLVPVLASAAASTEGLDEAVVLVDRPLVHWSTTKGA
jgi:putative NIF3 family GTP cyclohydrolase 1 type 2